MTRTTATVLAAFLLAACGVDAAPTAARGNGNGGTPTGGPVVGSVADSARTDRTERAAQDGAGVSA